MLPRWLDALETEMAQRSRPGQAFNTLYLGGGTPSLLPPGALERVMAGLRAHFRFSPDCEMTIEANPCDLEPGRAGAMRALGFNRVSLGAQSFDDGDLRRLGRRHTAAEARAAVRTLRAAGFRNLGLDLMWGLEGQSEAGWLRTLEQAVSLDPEHLSCYQLTVEPRTPLGLRQARGGFRPPPEPVQRRLYLRTAEFLEGSGYLHYEVSNFARGALHRSRHNLNCWHRRPYLGLGPSAHSFDGARRCWNVRSLRGYCGRLERGNPAAEGSEVLSAEQVGLERVALGLRLKEGVRIRDLPPSPETSRTLARLQAEGLVEVAAGRAAPTPAGFLVADRLPACFF